MEFTPDQLEKIKNFKWDDEEEGSESQPGIAIAEDVIDCAKSIASYVLENISAKHYENGRFVIPVPLELHRLLRERYNLEWTDDSRAKIFELVQGVFAVRMDADRGALIKRINEHAFPNAASPGMVADWKKQGFENPNAGKARKEYDVRWSKLYDEPSVSIMGPSGEDMLDRIVVEIEVV